MAKYFYSFFIILYLISLTKEEKDLNSEQWSEIEDYNFLWKSTKNVMNLSSKKGNTSFLFENKSDKMNGVIWNSFNFSKKKEIQISFNLNFGLGSMLSERNPLKLEIVFISSS